MRFERVIPGGPEPLPSLERQTILQTGASVLVSGRQLVCLPRDQYATPIRWGRHARLLRIGADERFQEVWNWPSLSTSLHSGGCSSTCFPSL